MKRLVVICACTYTMENATKFFNPFQLMLLKAGTKKIEH